MHWPDSALPWTVWMAGATATPASGSFNLRRPSAAPATGDLRLRLNLALGAAALLLLGIVMAQSVSNREQALVAMTEAVQKTQDEAKQVSALRKTLVDTIDSANFLAEKRRTSVTMVELLDDLSRRLPDNTYLERINLADDNRLDLGPLRRSRAPDRAAAALRPHRLAELPGRHPARRAGEEGPLQPDRSAQPKGAKPDAKKPAPDATGGKADAS